MVAKKGKDVETSLKKCLPSFITSCSFIKNWVTYSPKKKSKTDMEKTIKKVIQAAFFTASSALSGSLAPTNCPAIVAVANDIPTANMVTIERTLCPMPYILMTVVPKPATTLMIKVNPTAVAD